MRMTGRDPGEKKRPRLLALICLLAVLLGTGANARAAEYRVYVGTYTGQGSEGIYAFRFNPLTGATSSVGLAAATDNPSFLAIHPNGRYLYAVNELDTFRGEPAGAVSVFAIDRGSGKLELLQQVSSLGAGPAYVSLDGTARYLLVANYNGGNVAVFPIGDDGRLGGHTAFVQDEGRSVNPERQAGPHAHSFQVTRDNRFALAADLGLDKLFVHRFDSVTGSLSPGSPGFVPLDPGSGPRHVALSPSGKFVYVLNELVSTVTVLRLRTGRRGSSHDPGHSHTARGFHRHEHGGGNRGGHEGTFSVCLQPGARQHRRVRHRSGRWGIEIPGMGPERRPDAP